jgi:hypothetical protein
MNDNILNKNIIEAIRSAYAAPTEESVASKSAERQGVMARTQSKINTALEDTAQDALASIEGLIGKTMDARTDKDISMKELGKLVMDATDPQEPEPASEDPDRQFYGSGVSIEDRFPETNISDTIADESTAPLSEVDPERRADEEFLRTGEPPAAETGEGLMSKPNAEPISSVSNVEPLSDPDIIEKIEAAPDTTAALEVVGESSSLPEGLINNPLSYILNKGFIGLSESNVDDHKSIVGFFKNSLGDKQTFATAGTQGATSIANDTRAWCGVFVDHVLTNLGLPRLETGDSWDRMRAKQYLNLGTKVDTDSATAGDLVIKKGEKTYHVGFYVGTQELVDLGGKKGIKEFQEALMSKGYDLPKFGADGDFGSESIAALKQYQKSLGMKETGVMDAETYKKLTGKDATTVTHVLMLGGNQNNEVNVTAYPASQIEGIRRVGEVAAIPKDTFSEITRDMQKGGGVL